MLMTASPAPVGVSVSPIGSAIAQPILHTLLEKVVKRRWCEMRRIAIQPLLALPHAGKGREEGPCHGRNPFRCANGRNHRTARFCLGRLHIELPNRRSRQGGRPRPQHLGYLLQPDRPGRQRRYRRHRLRSLSSLSGRHRPDARARRHGLPLFRGVAAGAAARARRRQRGRSRILRPPHRRRDRRRNRALALPLSLGPAAGAGRPWRLEQSGLCRMVRGLCGADRRGASATGSSVLQPSTSLRCSLFWVIASAGRRPELQTIPNCCGRSIT
jgi:hypothetical protein